MDRGQASITALEAGIGVLLIGSLTVAFALGVPTADEREQRAALDRYAQDAATILANEAPRHANQTRLSEVSGSAAAFEREADALERRLRRLLPSNLQFVVVTEYGSVGYRRPSDVQTGAATVLTANGSVTIRVWYV